MLLLSVGNPCPKPSYPENGYINNYGHRYPVVLEYHCKNGFVLDNLYKPKCQKNGKWSEPFPKCIGEYLVKKIYTH